MIPSTLNPNSLYDIMQSDWSDDDLIASVGGYFKIIEKMMDDHPLSERQDFVDAYYQFEEIARRLLKLSEIVGF